MIAWYHQAGSTAPRTSVRTRDPRTAWFGSVRHFQIFLEHGPVRFQALKIFSVLVRFGSRFWTFLGPVRDFNFLSVRFGPNRPRFLNFARTCRTLHQTVHRWQCTTMTLYEVQCNLSRLDRYAVLPGTPFSSTKGNVRWWIVTCYHIKFMACWGLFNGLENFISKIWNFV